MTSRRTRAGQPAGWRPGFTLVELLVVIAIIGVLVSLLLPAVQAARESGRRTKCQNHLRQLGVATQNYTGSLGVFPASGIYNKTTTDVDVRSGTMFSWITLILPYMEQENLHGQFNFSFTVTNQAKDPQAFELDTLRRPSDSAHGRFYVEADAIRSGKRFAKGNYAAWVSPYHVEFQQRFPGALTTGRRTFAHFQADGTSNTLMFSEVLTRDLESDQRGAWALGWTGSTILAFDKHHAGAVTYGEHGYTADTTTGNAQPPNSQGANFDTLYNCANPADSQLRRMPCITNPGYLSAAPRSHHPGGVNAIYVDNHIGFVPNIIEERTMAYLVGSSDGQAVSPP